METSRDQREREGTTVSVLQQCSERIPAPRAHTPRAVPTYYRCHSYLHTRLNGYVHEREGREGRKERGGGRSERGRREERKVRRREGAELVSDRGEERRRGGGCSAEVDVAGPAE